MANGTVRPSVIVFWIVFWCAERYEILYKHDFRKIRRISRLAFEGNPGCLDSTSHTMTPMY